MSVLDNLPHECTIRRRTHTQGTLGKGKPSYVTEYTGVACWEQLASASEVRLYQKRGQSVSTVVYLLADYGLTTRHEILITKRNGVAVSAPKVLQVTSVDDPDATLGIGIVWKAGCEYITSGEV